MTRQLFAGLVLLAIGISPSRTVAQTGGDGCSLLQPADLQTLAGAANPAGTASTDGLGSRLCQYVWGKGGNVQSGRFYLNVSVTLASKMFPGMDTATIRQGLLTLARGSDPGAVTVSGIGDGAVYQSDRPIEVKATALVKGNLMIIALQSADARAHKDHVIALLRAAAGRL